MRVRERQTNRQTEGKRSSLLYINHTSSKQKMWGLTHIFSQAALKWTVKAGSSPGFLFSCACVVSGAFCSHSILSYPVLFCLLCFILFMRDLAKLDTDIGLQGFKRCSDQRPDQARIFISGQVTHFLAGSILQVGEHLSFQNQFG